MSSALRPASASAWRTILATTFVFAAVASAWADGPATISTLQGGAQVVNDSDTGNGERWGRSGGRTFTIIVNTPQAFTSLLWGVDNGTAPNLGFDGIQGSGPLTFSGGQSNLPAGRAVWIGTNTIQTAFGPQSVNTGFTLTLTKNGSPVPLVFQGGGVNPGLDVLAEGGSFTVNELFTINGGAALDVYDSMATIPGNPPGTTGPVMTGLTTGFYFSLTQTDITHTQLDADLSNKIAAVKSDTSFLVIDTPGRFGSVMNELGLIEGLVRNLPPPNIPNNLATNSDVQNAQKGLQQMILTLFGILPCDPNQAGPLCTTATFINQLATKAGLTTVDGKVNALQDALNAVQGSLSALPAVQSGINGVNDQILTMQGKLDTLQAAVGAGNGKIDIHLVEVPDLSNGRRRRWIMTTSLAGNMIAAELTGVISIDSRGHAPAVVDDLTSLVTVTPLQTGVFELSLRAGARGISQADAFEISVRYLNGATTAHGSTLVHN